MIRCLDIHTHHQAPQPMGVISVNVTDFSPVPQQWYSVGIHPWTTMEPLPMELREQLSQIASLPEVVAIGECGIDKLKGGPLFRQLQVMNFQMELSEKLGKPLVIHDVKAHDVIVGLKKDSNPSQNWLVHGFRGKPTVAKMLTDAGIFLSFGEKFNPEALAVTPRELILAETDESPLSIEEIIAGLSEAAGYDLTEIIAENTLRFLNKHQTE